MMITHGFTDIHVHFREPGYSAKETIRTGSLSAARGGYTTVCAMPNLNPVPDSPENIALEQAIIDRDSVIEVLPYASITKGRKGLELTDFSAMKHLCCAFSDDGSGVQSEEMMLKAMKSAAQNDVIIAAHCEDGSCRPKDCPESEWKQIERDLRLCELTGCRYHVCHISTKMSVDLIRAAKARGVRVTCETAPHYLLLCKDEFQPGGRFTMNPPLRESADREALIEGLKDGTIDAVATDHAPHTAEDKAKGANGIVGLETAFPALYTGLVKTGRISLERLLDAMSTAPRRIFNLKGGENDAVELDLDTKFVIDSREFATMGRFSPFDGWEVYGRVVRTIKDGKTVYSL